MESTLVKHDDNSNDELDQSQSVRTYDYPESERFRSKRTRTSSVTSGAPKPVARQESSWRKAKERLDDVEYVLKAIVEDVGWSPELRREDAALNAAKKWNDELKKMTSVEFTLVDTELKGNGVSFDLREISFEKARAILEVARAYDPKLLASFKELFALLKTLKSLPTVGTDVTLEHIPTPTPTG